jgi:hypothetical protein
MGPTKQRDERSVMCFDKWKPHLEFASSISFFLFGYFMHLMERIYLYWFMFVWCGISLSISMKLEVVAC